MKNHHRPTIGQKIVYYFHQRDLLLNYVRKDLKERYVGSIIGFYWSVINPLILLGIYTFVFTVIFKVRFSDGGSIGHAALYIFCAMIPWMAFSDSVNRSASVLIDHGNLIKKVMFPSKILPMYIAVSHFVNLGIGLVILFIAIAAAGLPVSWPVLLLPVYLAGQMILTLGFCWLASAINVFFRDMAQIIAQLLTIWMYLTPIFYSLQIIPERYRPAAYLNPMTHLVEGYRAILLDGKWPDWWGLLIFYLFSCLIFAAGYFFFTRNQHHFPDLI